MILHVVFNMKKYTGMDYKIKFYCGAFVQTQFSSKVKQFYSGIQLSSVVWLYVIAGAYTIWHTLD